MLGFFPKPYKDEYYYSILARYHQQSGNSFKSQSLQDLTGRFYRMNYVFPFGLNQLVAKLQQFSEQFTTEYFVQNHTLIPLIRHFMSDENLNNLINKKGDFKTLFRNFRTRDGEVDSKEHLYYCSECLKEQFETNGEGYWNRIHQTPGLFVCLHHRCLLNRLNNHSFRDEEFILPKLVDIQDPKIVYSDSVMDCLFDLAEDIKYLFEKEFCLYPKDYYLQKYKTILKVKGLAFPIQQSQEKLIDLMLGYYPIKFLELLNSSFQKTDRTVWLRYLNGNGKYINTLHPIRHLLLMRLLCGSARGFFETEYIYEPYGKGPWICMNPLSNHYLERVVTDIDISIHEAYRVIQGDIKCSCGFQYRLIGDEKSPFEIENFSLRILKRGAVWEKNFNNFVKQGLTLKEISIRTNLSVETIRKIIKREHLDFYRVKELEKKRRRNEKATGYKKVLLECKHKNPSLSRNELRKLVRKEYNWLIKNEKEWIEENSPPVVLGRYAKVRPYSKEEDLKLLNVAETMLLEWSLYEISKGKLIRKSKFKLLSLLGLRGDYSKRKFPLTVEYLYSQEELIIDFQKRKVRNIMELELKNNEVTLVQVVKAANLLAQINKEGSHIIEFIKNEVELHNKFLIKLSENNEI